MLDCEILSKAQKVCAYKRKVDIQTTIWHLSNCGLCFKLIKIDGEKTISVKKRRIAPLFHAGKLI